MIDFNPQKLTFQNVDRFYIKRSIYQFLSSKFGVFRGDILDIGCGEMPYRKDILSNSNVSKYIGLDINGALEYRKGVKPDYFWDGIKMPFEDWSFDSGFATEVLEHCPDPFLTLTEINRVLKPDSPLVLTVPFLWPTHESPNDYYRFTPFALKKIIESAGFKEIEIVGLGGWHASFTQMIGLWLRRSRIPLIKQRILFAILKPFINYLIKKDIKSPVFTDQQMWTGFGIVAWKR